jgi:hypothetical protein
VPDTVTKAEFRLFGADDPAAGQGGDVKASLAVTPGEILLLQLGSKGGASSVLRGESPLLIAGGGNGAEPNYVAPGATDVESEPPGGPNPPFPGNGSIYVSWSAGWFGDRPENNGSTGNDGWPEPVPARCLVPRLRGLRPGAARSAIAANRCTAGAFARLPARRRMRGRVVSQAPPPGTVLPAGSAIAAILGAPP